MKDVKISGMNSDQLLSLYDRTKEFITYLDNETQAYEEKQPTLQEEK